MGYACLGEGEVLMEFVRWVEMVVEVEVKKNSR